jgi:hypothetical protein
MENLREGGKPVDQSQGVSARGMKNGRAILEVSSGSYSFESR